MADTTTPSPVKETKDPAPEETTPAPAPTSTGAAEESGASEEPQAYFEPVVQLDKVDVVSGEEDEDVLYKQRCKLFQYTETLLDKGTGTKTWCERGIGEVRFLKHKEFGKVRLLMRQEKTHKITMNHLVESRAELTQNMGSDRAWVWSCYDFSEGETEAKVFALRFGNAEIAKEFKKQHDLAKENNKKYEAGADAEDTSAGDEAAAALDDLKVKEESA